MKKICAILMVMMLIVIGAETAQAATLGDYAKEIEPGNEYVFESVDFPGLVVTPDENGWMSLKKFNADDPYGAHQVWAVTNYDEHVVKNMFGEDDLESYYRDGYITISNHAASYGTGTQRMITYTPQGYYWKPKEYNADASVSDAQWWYVRKPWKDDNGHQVFRFGNAASRLRFAAGGHSALYARKLRYD